jgi:hypothetical protein
MPILQASAIITGAISGLLLWVVSGRGERS